MDIGSVMKKVAFMQIILIITASFVGCLEELEIDSSISGCTDSVAINYNETATLDDGSCEYLPVEGCMDSNATNYDSGAEVDDGSCEYSDENPDIVFDFMLDEDGDGPDYFPGTWSGAVVIGSNIYMTIGNFSSHGEFKYWQGGRELGIINLDDKKLTMVDINVGGQSFPFSFTGVNDKVIFDAIDGVNGRELWVTDGTEAGTNILKDIRPGSNSSYPDSYYSNGNLVYFTAITEKDGRELFATDGTEVGTILLSNFSEHHSSVLQGFFLGEDFFFNHGRELWISDGTPSGTFFLADLFGYFSGFELGGEYFIIKNEHSSSSLWSYNQITESLTEIEELNFDSTGGLEFVQMGSYVYFITHDNLLYRTNGQLGGSSEIYDFSTDPFSPSDVTNLKTNGCDLIMSEDDSIGRSVALWRSDGTGLGTYKWMEGDWGYLGLLAMNLFGNTMISVAWNGSLEKIYETNLDTNAITTPVNISRSFPIENNYLFSDQEIFWLDSDSEIARYTIENATEPSTCDYDLTQHEIIDFVEHPSGITGSTTSISASEGIFYQLTTTSKGTELWHSDGTYGGTYMVKDIHTGSESSHPFFFASNGTHTFFTADDGIHGRELWITDGTSSGTYLLKDVAPGPTLGFSSDPEFQFVGDLTYFKTLYGDLWVTDGTESGTYSLTDSGPSNVANLYAHGPVVYFSASSSEFGHELWKTDAGEVVQVADICSASCSSTPSDFVVYKGGIAFTAEDSTYGREVWVSDGTSSGTVLFADVLTGSDSSTPSNLYTMGSDLFFAANNSVHGYELWVAHDFSDFEMVLDINPGTDGSNVDNLLSYEGVLYFTADDGWHGVEIWYYDNAKAEAHILVDISATGSSSPHEIVVANEILYFLADDGVHGIDIWSYNLISNEEKFYTDYTGPPTSLTLVDDTIFFSASGCASECSTWTIWYLDTSLPYDGSLTVIIESPVV
tara:strand:- start:95 stop:2959 length:2865 start_codon:yes stop_codon:yes gene_type:complete